MKEMADCCLAAFYLQSFSKQNAGDNNPHTSHPLLVEIFTAHNIVAGKVETWVTTRLVARTVSYSFFDCQRSALQRYGSGVNRTPMRLDTHSARHPVSCFSF